MQQLLLLLSCRLGKAPTRFRFLGKASHCRRLPTADSQLPLAVWRIVSFCRQCLSHQSRIIQKISKPCRICCLPWGALGTCYLLLDENAISARFEFDTPANSHSNSVGKEQVAFLGKRQKNSIIIALWLKVSAHHNAIKILQIKRICKSIEIACYWGKWKMGNGKWKMGNGNVKWRLGVD